MKIAEYLKWWKESIAAVLVIVGAAFAFDNTYAKNHRVDVLATRLDYKIANDKFFSIQQRIWRLEDRYGKDCQKAEREIKDECRNLFQQLKELEQELKRLEEKK